MCLRSQASEGPGMPHRQYRHDAAIPTRQATIRVPRMCSVDMIVDQAQMRKPLLTQFTLDADLDGSIWGYDIWSSVRGD